MKWRATTDPDLIESPPYFIRRGSTKPGAPIRYVLGWRVGQNDECLGGFDSADEAKTEAERHDEDRKPAAA